MNQVTAKLVDTRIHPPIFVWPSPRQMYSVDPNGCRYCVFRDPGKECEMADICPSYRKPEEEIMENSKFIELCKSAIVDYFNSQADSTDKNGTISKDQVFVVWLVKVLQNHKALLSTTIPDGMYYECTYNGDKGEMYVDAYKKWKNFVVKV